MTCWNGFLPSTSVFFNIYPLSFEEVHATFCHFGSKFSAGTDSDVMSFHATPAQNKKSPKLVLNMIFVQFQLQISSQKITPNTTNINLVSDGFCGPVFKDFSDLAVLFLDSRFLVSNLHRCLASSLIVF